MAYDQQIIDAIYARAQKVSDPSKRNRYLRAALQTGIVESGLQNLNHGDADSLGWRQERQQFYKNPMNITASVDRFFDEAAQLDRGQRSWELAADVQRPAAQYRGRYKDVAKEAASLLRGFSGSSPAGGAPAPGGAVPQVGLPSVADGGQAGDFTSLLGSLLSKPQQAQPQSMGIAPPQFSSAQALPQGFRPIGPSQAQAPEQDTLSATLGLLDSLRGSGPTVQGAEAPTIAQTVLRERTTGRPASTGLVPLGGSKNAGKGAFTVSGPEPGRLQKPLVSFMDKVAEIYGGPLVGLDGSSHSKYTVNGNVSAHYTGNATDVFTIGGKPATGERLIRAGRAALIAAGMPREQALKAPGGLYNVGGYQIIFGVDGAENGGDHTDHLHVGRRPK